MVGRQQYGQEAMSHKEQGALEMPMHWTGHEHGRKPRTSSDSFL